VKSSPYITTVNYLRVFTIALASDLLIITGPELSWTALNVSGCRVVNKDQSAPSPQVCCDGFYHLHHLLRER